VRPRHVLLAFALAFSLGVIVSTYLLRRAAPVALEIAAAPTAAAPAADADPGAQETSAEAVGNGWPDDAGTPEQVLYAQAQLMDAAIARLTARTPGRTNLYLIAFAGDGEENVFRNEVEYVARLFDERYATIGHSLLLVNNPATLTRYPLASLSNLQTALDAVAARMDPQTDVLLLFLTSHGSPEHELYVALDPLPLDQIAPDDLAGVLDDTHIRNRVVVISACYSGGFIDALKSPASMIITAARADRASFGCGTQSAITDFGRAFFVEGLNDAASFTAAFAEARKRIDERESKAGEKHSQPQIVSTPLIEERLKAWRDGIQLGPRVPFEPAAKPRAATPSVEASH
jgi:hypothetical protein